MPSPDKTPTTSLSAYEEEVARKIADMFQITLEEAVTRTVQASIARRMKKRTGKAPAKVYGLPRGKR